MVMAGSSALTAVLVENVEGNAICPARGDVCGGGVKVLLGGIEVEAAIGDHQVIGFYAGKQRVEPGIGVRQKLGQVRGDGGHAGRRAVAQEGEQPGQVAHRVSRVDAQRAVAVEQQRRHVGEHRRAVDRRAGIGGDGAGIAERRARAGLALVHQRHGQPGLLRPQGGGQPDGTGTCNGQINVGGGGGHGGAVAVVIRCGRCAIGRRVARWGEGQELAPNL
jgi:hypothetical protein